MVTQPSPSCEPPDGVTRQLARYLSAAEPGDLPQAGRKEAVRTFFNWLGCTIGGSHHQAVDIAVRTLAPYAGPPQAAILGRSERFDILHASMVNGISSHVLDFDDTHLRSVIHPAGPVVAAAFAFAEFNKISGRDFLNAVVVGVETECRIGNAVFPDHYDVGWHITGTAGVFGAAAAVGKLMRLNEQQMLWALGIAASQPVGLREMFGTMTKSFHPGRAAQNGLIASLLAGGGYTSSSAALEAERGWARLTSTKQDWDSIVRGLGDTYEILSNTYKPFACGIVSHPAIDGCIQLRNEYRLSPADIDRITLSVHPLVLELTGKTRPEDGLGSKFSVYHAAAVAIIHGKAGEQEFSDASVRDEITVALRKRVSAVIDTSIAADAARVEILLNDGRRLQKQVPHAIGSLARPMSDGDLHQKFLDLVADTLGPARSNTLAELCWNLDNATNVDEVVSLARPG